MKATIDVPDELYRKVEAKSALEGRTVGAVTVELFEQWLGENSLSTGRSVEQHPEDGNLTVEPAQHSAQQRLAAWLKMGTEASANAPPGPTATEILEADRNRLERR